MVVAAAAGGGDPRRAGGLLSLSFALHPPFSSSLPGAAGRWSATAQEENSLEGGGGAERRGERNDIGRGALLAKMKALFSSSQQQLVADSILLSLP